MYLNLKNSFSLTHLTLLTVTTLSGCGIRGALGGSTDGVAAGVQIHADLSQNKFALGGYATRVKCESEEIFAGDWWDAGPACERSSVPDAQFELAQLKIETRSESTEDRSMYKNLSLDLDAWPSTATVDLNAGGNVIISDRFGRPVELAQNHVQMKLVTRGYEQDQVYAVDLNIDQSTMDQIRASLPSSAETAGLLNFQINLFADGTEEAVAWASARIPADLNKPNWGPRVQNEIRLYATNRVAPFLGTYSVCYNFTYGSALASPAGDRFSDYMVSACSKKFALPQQ